MPGVRIVTVTLNPAIDRVMEIEQFRVGQHQRGRRLGWYPAGKGINVSRVLAVLGTRSIATGFVGRDELALFEEFLEDIGGGRVVMQLLGVRGRTRENTTIMDPVLDTETHIRDEGIEVQPEDVRRVSSKVAMLARDGVMMVFAGSLSPGVSLGDFRSMLHRCHDGGARAVVDAGGKALSAVLNEDIWLLKINSSELGEVTGMPTHSQSEVVAAARSLTRDCSGNIKHVIITRAEAGAVLLSPDACLVARVFVHPGRIANTVGSGDSLLAGVLHEWSRGAGWSDAMRRGVATATANAVSRTPGIISLDDVREFWDAAAVETLDELGEPVTQ